MEQTFNVNKDVFGGSRNITHILAIVSKGYGLKVDSGHQLVRRVLGGLPASLGECRTKHKLRAVFQPQHLHPVRKKSLLIDGAMSKYTHNKLSIHLLHSLADFSSVLSYWICC